MEIRRVTTDGRRVSIGWRERVDLPEWGLKSVRAKIDTGARTSAIDVANIEHLDNGKIRFEVVAKLRPKRKTRWIEATPVRVSNVKSSNGELQERIVCKTMLRIGHHEQQIELSLVCRKQMLCRMLVGRLAIADRFLVDPGEKYILTNRSKPANDDLTPRGSR
ncbi:MAG: ATP-dependent zinc protease [Leptolyngbya sp. SIO3F4]|nr:ATP-dependent zinc protease [Leptolyngbya sp. SIO3F4]